MSGATSTSPQRTSAKVRTKLNYNRISLACDNCRRRKIRCIYDKGKEPCQMCVRLGKTCIFTPRKESSDSDEAAGPVTTPDFQTPPSDPHSPHAVNSFIPGSSGASSSQPVPYQSIPHDMSMYSPHSTATWHSTPPNISMWNEQYTRPTQTSSLLAPLPVRQNQQYQTPIPSQSVMMSQNSHLRPLAPNFTPYQNYQNPLMGTDQGYMREHQQWLPVAHNMMQFDPSLNQQVMYSSMAPPEIPMLPSQPHGQVPVLNGITNIQPFMHQQAGLASNQIRHDSLATRWHNKSLGHGDSHTDGEYYEQKQW